MHWIWELREVKRAPGTLCWAAGGMEFVLHWNEETKAGAGMRKEEEDAPLDVLHLRCLLPTPEQGQVCRATETFKLELQLWDPYRDHLKPQSLWYQYGVNTKKGSLRIRPSCSSPRSPPTKNNCAFAKEDSRERTQACPWGWEKPSEFSGSQSKILFQEEVRDCVKCTSLLWGKLFLFILLEMIT